MIPGDVNAADGRRQRRTQQCGIDVSAAASRIACMAAFCMAMKQVPPPLLLVLQFRLPLRPALPLELNIPPVTSFPSETTSGHAPVAR